MIVKSFYFHNTTTVVYIMNKGERIGRHNHIKEGIGHTSGVVSGRIKITLYRNGVPSENKHAITSEFEVVPQQAHVELDHKTDHDIEALEDGTIVVNMSKGKKKISDVYEHGEGQAGVMIADGTIVK